MNKKIEIRIRGPVGSDKSTVAHAIQDVLEGFGASVTLEDGQDGDVAMENYLERVAALKGLAVAINTIQAPLRQRSTTRVTADHGVTFLLRVVRQGDRYGHDMCFTHAAEDPLVEFYDKRHAFDYDYVGTREEAEAAGAVCLGQFVTRYNLDTILEHGESGLILHGGIKDWKIDGEALTKGLQALHLI